jgi:phosphoserine aminotransferase
MKYDRIWNFNPGPAAVPLEVLEQVHESWFNLNRSGMNVMEMSHRSKEYEAIHNRAKELIKQLLGFGNNYHVLFLQGGASLQFAMVPMNFLYGKTADYIHTGSWAGKAIKEAKLFGTVNLAFDGKPTNFNQLPHQDELKLTPGAAYVHLTSNETIGGIQFHNFPNTKGVPIVADMSSDILSRRFDPTPFGLIYAGAQKNLGPSGVTLVVMRDDFYKTAREGLATMLSYKTHDDENSLYNTPNTFGIFFMCKVLEWVAGLGGMVEMERRNREKADTLYNFIDSSGGFYRGTAEKESRSWMNACLRMPSEDLEAKFISEAKTAGFIGLKGHRSVGGIRVSMYNAVPIDAIRDLIGFMKSFRAKNG